MPDPTQEPKSARPAPQLAEVRRMLDRYRRSAERPRGARRRTDVPPALRPRRRD